jgi:hypothetical protein
MEDNSKSARNNPLADIANDVERDVETWDAEVDPKLAGQVIDVGTIETDFGESPTANVLTTDGREVRVNGFGAVLKRALSGIDVGDLVAFRYLGKTQPRKAGQQAYKDFRIIVRNSDGSPKSRRHRAASEEIGEVAPEPIRAQPVAPPPEEEPW